MTSTSTIAGLMPSVHGHVGSTLLLLRFAAARWHVPIDEASVERALDGREGHHDNPGALEAELRNAAPVAGFGVHLVRLHGDELARVAHGRSPAFRALADGAGNVRWVALVGMDGNRPLLTEVFGDGAPVALPAGASVLSEGDWVLLEPVRPLEAAGGHGGHPSPWQRLVAILRPEKRDLWVVVAYAVAVGLLSLAVPVAVQALVNTVAFGVLRQPVLVLTLLVLCGLGFAGAMQAAQVHVVEILQRRLFVRAAVDAAGRLAQADVAAFDGRSGPELVNRFFDVVTLQKSVSILLLEGLGVVLQVMIGALILGFYHPLLLAFDVVLLAAMIFIVVVLGRGGVSTSLDESQAKYAVAAWLEELASRGRTFHTHGGRLLASRRAQRLCGDYLDARRSHFRVVIRQTIATLVLHAVASAALLGVGAILVMDRQLSLGQLIAAEIIVSAMLGGSSKLGKYLETGYDLLTAADKLGYLIDVPLERTDGESPRGLGPAAVRLRDVGFTYAPTHDPHDPHPGPSDHHPVFEHLSLDVTSGQHVAIVGDSGAGRSTLADLILGFRTPTGGAVFVDGVDLRGLRLADARDQLALARDPDLFEGTVAENLRAGRAAVGLDEARWALDLVELREVIEAMPSGLQQKIPPHGAPLSSSQAMLLGLARAAAGAPRLLIVDAVLDELDQARQDRLLHRLTDPSHPWTLVLLTRHQRLAARLPRALSLSHGQLAPLSRDEPTPAHG